MIAYDERGHNAKNDRKMEWVELTIRQHPSYLCSSFAAMSRGNKAPIVGILSSSMRDNYHEFGVEEVRGIIPLTLRRLIVLLLEQYYKKVGATYRNPHFPGIRSCLFSWFNRYARFYPLWFLFSRENNFLQMVADGTPKCFPTT